MSQLAPIHSIKHIVDIQLGLAIGVFQEFSLVITRDAPALAISSEVETGCRVNGIFLNVQCSVTTSAALSNIYMVIYKNAGENISNALFVPNAIGISDVKTKVFHQEMSMTERSTAGNPRVLFKGVIAIPKHMRRMGINDEIHIGLLSPGTAQDVCIQCIYKEYR